MPATYEPIATQTLMSNASSITFSSIPGTYTDLVLVANLVGTASSNVNLQFNGDTATNYSSTRLRGTGTNPAESSRFTNNASMFGANPSGTADQYGTFIWNIMNYSNATTNKTVIYKGGSANSEITALVGLWRKTPEAINSVTVLIPSYEFRSGSVFSLFGIKAA